MDAIKQGRKFLQRRGKERKEMMSILHLVLGKRMTAVAAVAIQLGDQKRRSYSKARMGRTDYLEQ